MHNSVRIHKVSFRHAFNGFKHNFTTQPNFRFHLFAMFLVTIMGWYFSLSSYEWLTLIFTYNMVIVSEMLNTSIEAMVDLISLERRQDAKIAKDVSAGMVLVSATFSIIVALFVFFPKIINIIN